MRNEDEENVNDINSSCSHSGKEILFMINKSRSKYIIILFRIMEIITNTKSKNQNPYFHHHPSTHSSKEIICYLKKAYIFLNTKINKNKFIQRHILTKFQKPQDKKKKKKIVKVFRVRGKRER